MPTAPKKTSEKYYVSVQFVGDYFKNRARIEKSAKKKSGGSGTGFGVSDCAWYDLSLNAAKTIRDRVRRLKCVEDVIIEAQH